VGTRGFVGFVIDGTVKIAYNHWDSYPSGLGTYVLGFLRKTRDSAVVQDGKPRAEAFDEIAGLARALRPVPEGKPTAEDIERLRPWTDLAVSSRSTDEWYCLLRGTQGDAEAILRCGLYEDAAGFPADSLFAEWGYLIDFDASVFEAYEGLRHDAHEKGRFASVPRAREGYYPVALKASWPLDSLPDDDAFIGALEPGDEEE
jgi:hypothetical protein